MGTASAGQIVSASAAILRGLDRTTGIYEDHHLVVGDSLQLGLLNVSLRDCRHEPENSVLRSYAFLDIWEADHQSPLFSAWMLSAAPALSSLDHHRYDVWLIRCSTDDEEAGMEHAANETGNSSAAANDLR